jgi:hypothetical protein
MATDGKTMAKTTDTAMKGAASIATPKTPAKTMDRKPQAGSPVSVRIDPIDRERLRETFETNGATLAGGIKLSALYVLQEIEAGRLRISKAGLFPGDRRLLHNHASST